MTMSEDLDKIRQNLARIKADREAILAQRGKAQEGLRELQGSLEQLRKNTEDQHQALRDAQSKREDHMRKQLQRDVTPPAAADRAVTTDRTSANTAQRLSNEQERTAKTAEEGDTKAQKES